MLRDRFLTQHAAWDEIRQTHIAILPDQLQELNSETNHQLRREETASTARATHKTDNLPIVILPSMFSKQERSTMGLDHLAVVESKLRRGFMEDVVNDLRIFLRRKALLCAGKKTQRASKGKSTQTRIQTKIGEINSMVDSLAKTYQGCRAAVDALGGDFLDMFPELKKTHLSIAGVANHFKLGRGYVNISWLWKMHKRASGSEDNLSEIEIWNNEGQLV